MCKTVPFAVRSDSFKPGVLLKAQPISQCGFDDLIS